jgi:hypothetical protein
MFGNRPVVARDGAGTVSAKSRIQTRPTFVIFGDARLYNLLGCSRGLL